MRENNNKCALEKHLSESGVDGYAKVRTVRGEQSQSLLGVPPTPTCH